MKKKWILGGMVVLAPLFILAAVSQKTSAERDAAGSEFVNEYILNLKNENRAAFSSDCLLKTGGKAVLFLPIGAEAGLYAELTPERTVANTAELRWESGRWRTEVAQGGVYTIRRAEGLIGELLVNRFKITMPDQLGALLISRPTFTCMLQ